jgi:hypothetical protein
MRWGLTAGWAKAESASPKVAKEPKLAEAPKVPMEPIAPKKPRRVAELAPGAAQQWQKLEYSEWRFMGSPFKLNNWRHLNAMAE